MVGLLSSCIPATPVADVIDGDTIRLTDRTLVRYLGIDTPEIGEPYYQEARQFNIKALSGKSITLEADVTNMLTVLRLVGVPDVAAILRERLGAANVTQLLVGPGHIPFEILVEAVYQESIPAAINSLAITIYGETLTGALPAYAASARLSVFERALAHRQLQQVAGLVASDPLGIGVLLGYAALKTNEIANLRTIAQGLLLSEKPDRIRSELLLVD